MPDVSYFFSLPGLLKPIILVLDIIVLICCAAVGKENEPEGMWFSWIVIVTALIIVFLMCLTIVLGVWNRLPVNKAFLEFVISAVYTILFIVVFITVVVAASNADSGKGVRKSADGAASFFSILLTGVFGLNTWGHWTMWRSGTDGTVQPPGPA